MGPHGLHQELRALDLGPGRPLQASHQGELRREIAGVRRQPLRDIHKVHCGQFLPIDGVVQDRVDQVIECDVALGDALLFVDDPPENLADRNLERPGDSLEEAMEIRLHPHRDEARFRVVGWSAERHGVSLYTCPLVHGLPLLRIYAVGLVRTNDITSGAFELALRALVQPIVREAIAEEIERAFGAVRELMREELRGARPDRAATDGALLSVAQAAQHLGVTGPTVRAYIRSGYLPAVAVGPGGRKYGIRPADLEAVLTRVPKGAPAVDLADAAAQIVGASRRRVARRTGEE